MIEGLRQSYLVRSRLEQNPGACKKNTTATAQPRSVDKMQLDSTQSSRIQYAHAHSLPDVGKGVTRVLLWRGRRSHGLGPRVGSRRTPQVISRLLGRLAPLLLHRLRLDWRGSPLHLLLRLGRRRTPLLLGGLCWLAPLRLGGLLLLRRLLGLLRRAPRCLVVEAAPAVLGRQRGLGRRLLWRGRRDAAVPRSVGVGLGRGSVGRGKESARSDSRASGRLREEGHDVGLGRLRARRGRGRLEVEVVDVGGRSTGGSGGGGARCGRGSHCWRRAGLRHGSGGRRSSGRRWLVAEDVEEGLGLLCRTGGVRLGLRLAREEGVLARCSAGRRRRLWWSRWRRGRGAGGAVNGRLRCQLQSI